MPFGPVRYDKMRSISADHATMIALDEIMRDQEQGRSEAVRGSILELADQLYNGASRRVPLSLDDDLQDEQEYPLQFSFAYSERITAAVERIIRVRKIKNVSKIVRDAIREKAQRLRNERMAKA